MWSQVTESYLGVEKKVIIWELEVLFFFFKKKSLYSVQVYILDVILLFGRDENVEKVINRS
jgi:hypothetical protein